MEESTDERLYGLSKVKLAQWLGLSVSVYMCLRYNYARSLIHPAPLVTLWVRGSTSKASFAAPHNGGPFKNQRRTEMQEKNILSDMRLPYHLISPSFPLISLNREGCTDSAPIFLHF